MMTYNKPESFDPEAMMFQRLKNINSILDKFHEELQAVKGVERFLHERCNTIEERVDIIEKKLEEQNETKELIHNSIKEAFNKQLEREVAPSRTGLKQSGIADIVDRLPTSPKKRGRPKLKVVWKPGDPEEDGVGE